MDGINYSVPKTPAHTLAKTKKIQTAAPAAIFLIQRSIKANHLSFAINT
jgi:hypothetical protein